MPVANCKRCDRIFNRVRRDICPACIQEEDRAFIQVKTFLNKNRDASMAEVVEQTGVALDWIVHMIQEGRLILRDNPNFTYPCESCGGPTQSGRLCVDCAQELASSLESASEALKEKARNDRRGGYYSR